MNVKSRLDKLKSIESKESKLDISVIVNASLNLAGKRRYMIRKSDRSRRIRERGSVEGACRLD